MHMKQLFYKISLSLLLVSAAFFYASAQAPAVGTASIDANLVIQIDPTKPLMETYTFSISTMAFKDEAAANRFFSLCRDNILNYTLDYANKTATVKLGLQFTEPRGWDVNEYNEYFAKAAERYRMMLTVVNE